jgi:hypothetical protein
MKAFFGEEIERWFPPMDVLSSRIIFSLIYGQPLLFSVRKMGRLPCHDNPGYHHRVNE